MNRPGERCAGFTVLEMAIVVALIALVSLMTAPGVLRRLPEYRLNAAEENLLLHLRAARLSALVEGRPVIFESRSDPTSYVVWVDRNVDGVMQSGEERLYTLPTSGKTPFAMSEPAGLFRPNGTFTALASVSSGMYTNQSTRSLTLTVNSTGTTQRRQLVVYGSGQVLTLPL